MAIWVQSWCRTLKKLILTEDKESGIFIHKIPIKLWLRTSTKTINFLALKSCPAHRISVLTYKIIIITPKTKPKRTKEQPSGRDSKVLLGSNL